MFGFGHNDSPIVREQCIAIAKDRVAHVKGEKRAQALEMVALTLELWKRGRANADGTIEIDVAVPSKGLLDMDSWTPPRAMASQGPLPDKTRRPAAELKPWECAGPGVQSDADLFERLLYTDHYVSAEKIEQLLGPGVALALLVERDGKTMPVDSLLFAVRYLWIIAFWALKGQGIQLLQLGSKEAKTKAHRLAASKEGAAKRKHDAEMDHAQWRAIARAQWHDDPTLKVEIVAVEVVEELRRREVKDLPSAGTVRGVLAGLKPIVLTELARSNRRR